MKCSRDILINTYQICLTRRKSAFIRVIFRLKSKLEPFIDQRINQSIHSLTNYKSGNSFLFLENSRLIIYPIFSFGFKQQQTRQCDVKYIKFVHHISQIMFSKIQIDKSNQYIIIYTNLIRRATKVQMQPHNFLYNIQVIMVQKEFNIEISLWISEDQKQQLQVKYFSMETTTALVNMNLKMKKQLLAPEIDKYEDFIKKGLMIQNKTPIILNYSQGYQQLDKKLVEYFVMKAQQSFLIQNYQRSQRILELINLVDGFQEYKLDIRSRIYFKRGQFESVKKCLLSAALQLRQQNVKFNILICRCFMKLFQTQDAIQYLITIKKMNINFQFQQQIKEMQVQIRERVGCMHGYYESSLQLEALSILLRQNSNMICRPQEQFYCEIQNIKDHDYSLISSYQIWPN